jgi:hypothetical protein
VGVLDFVFELMIPGEFWFGFFGFFQWHNKRHLHLMIIFFCFHIRLSLSLCLSLSVSSRPHSRVHSRSHIALNAQGWDQ